MSWVTAADCGIFTQTLGTPPNRQFVIRWKTTYFNHPGEGTAEFEVLLTEGSDTLSAIYGATLNNGLEAASGIQQDLIRVHVVLLLRSRADTGPACELHTHNLWQSHADANGDSYSTGRRQQQLQQPRQPQLRLCRRGLRQRLGRVPRRRLARRIGD